MFFPGSRYEKSTTYTITLKDGRTVTAVEPPLPSPGRLLGFHRRLQGQRLDLIASRYLKDPTTFWRLCDTANSMSPDALAVGALIPVPEKGT